MESTEFILTLLNLPGIGSGTVRRLLKAMNQTTYDVNGLADLLDTASETQPRIKPPTQPLIESAFIEAKCTIDYCAQNNICILTPNDDRYPNKLREIRNSPVVIYAKGNLQCLNKTKNLAIIGTRKPSNIGRETAERLSSWFAKCGYVITSGLAIGCDTAAHLGCLEAKGETIAILANGLDQIYPKCNTELSKKILSQNGCLISEYRPNQKIMKNFFVERDRLQSALAQGVLVIETSAKGGSMHTVRFGIEQGRKIACVIYLKNQQAIQEGNLQLVEQKIGIPLSTNDELILFEILLRQSNAEVEHNLCTTTKSNGYTQLSLWDK